MRWEFDSKFDYHPERSSDLLDEYSPFCLLIAAIDSEDPNIVYNFEIYLKDPKNYKKKYRITVEEIIE